MPPKVHVLEALSPGPLEVVGPLGLMPLAAAPEGDCGTPVSLSLWLDVRGFAPLYVLATWQSERPAKHGSEPQKL